MSQVGTLVSVIAIMGCLLLVSQHSGFRQLGFAKFVRLALIWAVIIVALVLAVQVLGLRLAN